jgi:hypothetical protein
MKRLALVTCAALLGSPLAAQAPSAAEKNGGSPNIQVLSHLRLGGYFHTWGIEIEQEMSRPYVYVSRRRDLAGYSIVSVADPRSPKLLYTWDTGNPSAHANAGGESGKYFKTKGRYYFVQSFEFDPKSSDVVIGGIVTDVTGLPDASRIKEVARIKTPESTTGVVQFFPYKHSDGRVLLFSSWRTFRPGEPPRAGIYDADKLLAGDPNQGLVGTVPEPAPNNSRGYHDMYVAYDPATKQDRFYGAGPGGFYVYDVSKPETPKLLTSLTGLFGPAARPHTVVATPDSRWAVTQYENQFAPIMVWDLAPGLKGQTPVIPEPVGAWIADLKDLSHNHEVRWPYVFAAAYEDGLQVLDISKPEDPRRVGWFYTCQCAHQQGYVSAEQPHGNSVFNGAFELDVRNADGLIVVSDANTGLWAFHMEGFDGWNGHEHDMPNISSAQDWDSGPEGAPRKTS